MNRRKTRIISAAFCLALIASVLSAQTRPSWFQIKDTPTTLSGYGITDALKLDLSNATGTVNPTGKSVLLGALDLKFSDLEGMPTNASYTLLGLSERDFFSLTGRPTTYAGYGLTEGVRLNLSNFVNSSLDPTGLQELKNAVGAELPENITANIVSATIINATSTANVKDLNADKIVVASQTAYDIDAARITSNNFSTTGTLGSVTFSIPFYMRHNADFFNSADFKGPVAVRNNLLVASQTNFTGKVYLADYARFEEIPDFVKGLANLNASGTTRLDSVKVSYLTELNTAYLNGIATFTKAAEFLAGATFWGTPNFKGNIWCDYTVGANRLTADTDIVAGGRLTSTEAVVASATFGRLRVETPIIAAAGMEFGDRILFDTSPYGRNIEHKSETAGLRLATGSVSITADDPDTPGVQIAGVGVNASGTVSVSGLHFALGTNTASFPADVSMSHRLRVGGTGYGDLATHNFTAYSIDAPYASHTQRLSALRLNFLSSLTNQDIPGSFITAHPTTGAVQHYFNNVNQLSLGAAGVTVSDFKVTGSVAPPLDFGSAGEIDTAAWDVGDGVSTVNLNVNKGSAYVNGLLSAQTASAASLIASQANIASATVARLEVGTLVYDFPSTGSASAVLASVTTTTLPVAFQHPSYPSSRDSDSGLYSPAGYQLGLRAGQAPGTPPWILLQSDRGIIATGVNSIYKAGSDAVQGLTLSGGTLTGGGRIYYGANSSPYVSISNASQEMMTTYGDIVRFGNVVWDDTYFFSIGGRSRVNGRLDVSDGVNVARSSAPVSPANGTIYYDTTTHKFRGYANGAWVDLN